MIFLYSFIHSLFDLGHIIVCIIFIYIIMEMVVERKKKKIFYYLYPSKVNR